jgi:hypothetical protein
MAKYCSRLPNPGEAKHPERKSSSSKHEISSGFYFYMFELLSPLRSGSHIKSGFHD